MRPALAFLILASMALTGCATLQSATTPASLNADADIAYITVATAFPSKAWPAWTALQAERAAYVALSGVVAPTALDLQADALRPAGSPPPVFLLVPEAIPSHGAAVSKLQAMAQGG